MLSGRYPSDEFAELRPRVTWDRVNGTVVARQGAKRVAITNAGTIPDRGLYGVFLADGSRDGARVGELDEEMVFEARAGETFLLGASTWRIEQITHDRVLVAPAPGEPGKMPFWKGEGPGRPIELGQAIGKLTRELRQAPPAEAVARLTSDHGLEPACGREPAAVPRRSAAGHRCRARRPHRAHRAIHRRRGRLAVFGADALRQPRACAVGDGRHRADPRRARPGRRGDVERRRLRGAGARRRRRPRSGAARAGPGRRRAAGGAAAGLHRDVRGALS